LRLVALSCVWLRSGPSSPNRVALSCVCLRGALAKCWQYRAWNCAGLEIPSELSDSVRLSERARSSWCAGVAFSLWVPAESGSIRLVRGQFGGHPLFESVLANPERLRSCCGSNLCGTSSTRLFGAQS
jgi:hypothetical protein